MQNNLNILVSDLSASQKSYYLIRNTNHLHNLKPLLNINVFTENLSRACMNTNFMIMNIAEAWAQPGPFIATELSTASKLVTYPCATHKFFYIWDLEFLRGHNRYYNGYSNVYLHKELTLVARSKEHVDLIENCFNKKVEYIVNDFNINQFLEIIK